MNKYEFWVAGVRYVVEADSRYEAAKKLREQLNS